MIRPYLGSNGVRYLWVYRCPGCARRAGLGWWTAQELGDPQGTCDDCGASGDALDAHQGVLELTKENQP